VRVAAQVSQMALMAAIVATLLYWPVAVVLAVLAAVFDLSLDAFITFGGAVNAFFGLLAWWLIACALAVVYAAWAFPWDAFQSHENR
jgi:hypothetical protein